MRAFANVYSPRDFFQVLQRGILKSRLFKYVVLQKAFIFTDGAGENCQNLMFVQ